MAYRSKLALALDGAVTFYAGDEGQRIDLEALLAQAPADAVFYVCGPDRLIDTVRSTAEALGLERTRIRRENFRRPSPKRETALFRCASSGQGQS